ncbi:hypothetical protein D3C86_2026230 [compost metagenome]
MNLETSVRRWMALNHAEYETATDLTEAAASEFDTCNWLDDETHPIWDWALEFVPTA